ncbi:MULTISPECIES: aspartate-semialdehyde dehydrogenase [unclassified Synechocystis]|uniref:Aspartate-semialdehyde dehydrogenase n=1 Tax=Synechocystis sp. (strain ATCC 27184 / PCC 6803 / Kazusa) TaxID=1111708 RepID=DHAS_SYNY3|nr:MULTISPECIES: aspartate-semialdehyde dehydrogenase [unclassified Synechocystis]Q55512.2 RecName: Full=Aspartate-semialdehyde dehydrogenase; Short=ASA dehydrogenase; Short=ASADH; AltName: Full=Aspartate-beta-semialdehyde dehydrogenase [Synechocystis sp. PCC 6803 substr. Kazusa]BAM53530.1 aspartate beta-semialdehyde dehydrogenese [Synechocystis sp. PCC 6803] [Bacillus subtilis BEST7613]ALJ69038.1 aspartate-semialdehyde dehydrogenase [Synechocystis sp. PCC 6803]AVP90901.1 aspartate-semialdehyde
MPSPIRVAILGATGAVGTELLELLASRNFPLAELKLLASPRSAGKTLEFQGEKLPIQAVDGSAFKGCDLVLASAGGSTSKRWAEEITKAGAVMVDNSSAFRMVPEVPLVVPEINPEAAQNHQGIIANPNCTTILMGVAIYPLHQLQPIKRIVVATYQSASGAGAMAMEEVKHQSRDILEGKIPQAEILPYPLAFNLFPHNSPITANHYCEEEMKMVQETRKIFAAEDIRITATCVRVPVLRAHSEAVNLEFATPFPVELAKTAIAKAPGVKLVEDWQKNYFPMPMDATGQDDVLVGRIRQDISHPNGLDLWLCGDQIRKGAALNAVQIAELLVERGWL